MTSNHVILDWIERSHESWIDTCHPEMSVGKIVSQPISPAWTSALSCVRIHLAKHEGVCHHFIFSGSSNSELPTMLMKMNIQFHCA